MDLNVAYHNISNLEPIIEERQMITGYYYKQTPKLPKVSAACSFTS
jgi:hypothetical protein